MNATLWITMGIGRGTDLIVYIKKPIAIKIEKISLKVLLDMYDMTFDKGLFNYMGFLYLLTCFFLAINLFIIRFSK